MLKILVIRNDKIGDFMLAWPAFSLLRQQYPDATITALVPAYTKPLAELCPSIDHVLVDDNNGSLISSALRLAALLKTGDFDVSISFYSQFRTALALYLAGIPRRIGPATKLAQLFLNDTQRQKRSLSLKPEYEYNIDLVRHFSAGNTAGTGRHATASPLTAPYLQFPASQITAIRNDFITRNKLPAGTRLVFVHVGTGGSAINLSLEQYSSLIHLISDSSSFFVLTAGPGELDKVNQLSTSLHDICHSVYHSTTGLVDFARFIAIADVFISGSTGPLHIAAALNRPTVAFYPARRSATALRWQTINDSGRRIHFSPQQYSGSEDMQTIDIEQCARDIRDFLYRLDRYR